MRNKTDHIAPIECDYIVVEYLQCYQLIIGPIYTPNEK